MIQPGLLLQNRYLVKRGLGRGGFAETWEVEDRGTRKVLKVLHNNYDEAIKLFKQEAEVLKKLNHPGIPKVEEDGYFIWQPEGHSQALHCLVMEFIEGRDLEKWVKQQKQPITQEQALEWLRRLVEILEQVHAQNCFHRDIKPSNIMRKEDGQLVLIDFGTARKLTETYEFKKKQGIVKGFGGLEYIAPEQLDGKAAPESDTFALGRTFVYLLTGKSISALSKDPNTGKLLWRNSALQASKPLADLIDELMEPLPDKRPKTQEILQRLSMLSIRFSIEPKLSSLPGLLRYCAQYILKHEFQKWEKQSRTQHEFQKWEKQSRTPVIALYGRTGAGKSSLINAIMDRQIAEVMVATKGTINYKPYEYSRDGWKLKFVDSRGAGDADGKVAFQQAIDYIIGNNIDILLFVIPAERDVDSDMEFLESLKAAHKRKLNAELPVILVINKIDCVQPQGWEPPYNLNLDSTAADNNSNSRHQEKQKNMRDCIKARHHEYHKLIDNYVPVCGLWDKFDNRLYNIKELLTKIYNYIPDEAAKHGFGGATDNKQFKEAVANRFKSAAAWLAFFVVLLPFDPNEVQFIQKYLVGTIAQIGGTNTDQSLAAKNLLEQLGATSTNAKTALSSTLAMGEAAIRYFIYHEEISQVQQTYAEEEERLEPEFQGNQKDIYLKLKQIDVELHERYGVKRIYDDKDDNKFMPVVPPQIY